MSNILTILLCVFLWKVISICSHEEKGSNHSENFAEYRPKPKKKSTAKSAKAVNLLTSWTITCN